MTTTSLSGARKAALLLLQLGSERAAKIAGVLDDDELETVLTEVASLGDDDRSQADAVLTELVEHLGPFGEQHGSGRAFARRLLAGSLPPERATSMMERLTATPFDALSGLSTEQLATLLAAELPQTIAVVLGHLGPERSLAVLRTLDTERQGDVAFRMASMGPLAPGALAAVEAGLARRLHSGALQEGRRQAERTDALVQLLGRADSETEAAILEEIGRLDPELAAQIKLQLFSFEDLVRLDDLAVQLLVREVDAKTLALALKGAGEAVRAKIFANMSERVAAGVTEEIDLLGAQRKADIEAARMEILAAMRRLEADGRITIARGDESLVD